MSGFPSCWSPRSSISIVSIHGVGDANDTSSLGGRGWESPPLRLLDTVSYNFPQQRSSEVREETSGPTAGLAVWPARGLEVDEAVLGLPCLVCSLPRTVTSYPHPSFSSDEGMGPSLASRRLEGSSSKPKKPRQSHCAEMRLTLSSIAHESNRTMLL